MTNKQLIDITTRLISQGKEGAYWDFKHEWHNDIVDLLKDIICFTNTVHDKDCFIIFGVSDNLELVGMAERRYKQADVIDALDKLVFASVYTPQISVETIMLEGKEIDVLIVYNTDQTPVYLKTNYGKMHGGCIYTRVEDRNTPDKGNANIHEIELLWKKRFGLTKPALQFIFDHLEQKHEWSETDGKYYNIYRPEYVLQIYEDDDIDRRSDEFYGYVQINASMCFEMLDIIANNTVLLTRQLAVLDSGRLVVPIPEWGSIHTDQYQHNFISYKYYVKDSGIYSLLRFFYDPANMEQSHALSCHLKVVLLFQNEQEHNKFEEYAALHLTGLEQYIKEHKADMKFNAGSDAITDQYKEGILTGKFLNQLLDAYRKSEVTVS